MVTDGEWWREPVVLLAHTKMAPRLRVALEGRVEVCAVDAVRDLPQERRAAFTVLLGYHFAPGALAELPALRWVHLTGTGVDRLDGTGMRAGTLVTTSARVPVATVAEYAVAGLLSLVKNLPGLERRPQDRPWYASSALRVQGATVLVLGAGRIGSAVITRLAAFGVRCVAVTRDGRTPVPGAYRTVATGDLRAEAAGADHLVCCLPVNPDTVGVVGAPVLAALPAHAVVVNVGRAATVDNGALHAALRAGTLRGAFVDVHDVEPLPPDDPVWTVPNLVVSPHCAFSFPEEPEEVAAAFLENLADLRAGRAPRDAVMVEGVR